MGFPRQEYWSGFPSLSKATASLLPATSVYLLGVELLLSIKWPGGSCRQEQLWGLGRRGTRPLTAATWRVYVSGWSALSHWGVLLTSFTRVLFFVTPWTVAHETPLSIGFSRQGHWSGLPFPPPGALPDPGIEPRSPKLQANFYHWATIEAPRIGLGTESVPEEWGTPVPLTLCSFSSPATAGPEMSAEDSPA